MKAKLVKEYEDYYLISDKEIESGDEYVKLDNRPRTVLLGTTAPSTKVPKLSKQNCDELFGVVDVEKLVDFYSTMTVFFKKGEIPTEKEIEDAEYISEIAFKAGFNKAMELNKNKVFTLEDIRQAYYVGYEDGKSGATFFQQLIQSLQQPTEIEVEIVMGDTPIWEDADVQGHVVCKKCGEWLESQIKPYTCKCINKPKLDSEGCLILKKI